MPSRPQPAAMTPGARYEFVYRNDAQRKDHWSVLDYLGENATEYTLNARPYAGTQALPKRWIISVTPVANSTPLVIDGRRLS